MSGPWGERTHREVALMTDDFRLYHRLALFFHEEGIDLLGIAPGDPVPSSVRAVLDGPPSDARSVPAREGAEATLLAVLARLDTRPVMREGPRHVVVGVDPGLRIGLAVLVDGLLYRVREAVSPEEAVGRVLEWRDGLGPARWVVHVGHGSPAEGRHILELLRQRFPEAVVHRVHEGASTPGSAVTGSRHTDAAVRIAKRPPMA